MASLYEFIVVGAGPAGITAGIYAARKKLRMLVVSKDVGGQTALSESDNEGENFASEEC
jgi:alkyl hydroperoxide reductase subunit F